MTMNFQGQRSKWSYFRNERVDWHGTKGLWVNRSWPWGWPLCDRCGEWMYRIVTRMASDVGVPLAYLVMDVTTHPCWNLIQTISVKWDRGVESTKYQQLRRMLFERAVSVGRNSGRGSCVDSFAGIILWCSFFILRLYEVIEFAGFKTNVAYANTQGTLSTINPYIFMWHKYRQYILTIFYARRLHMSGFVFRNNTILKDIQI